MDALWLTVAVLLTLTALASRLAQRGLARRVATEQTERIGLSLRLSEAEGRLHRQTYAVAALAATLVRAGLASTDEMRALGIIVHPPDAQDNADTEGPRGNDDPTH